MSRRRSPDQLELDRRRRQQLEVLEAARLASLLLLRLVPLWVQSLPAEDFDDDARSMAKGLVEGFLAMAPEMQKTRLATDSKTQAEVSHTRLT